MYYIFVFLFQSLLFAEQISYTQKELCPNYMSNVFVLVSQEKNPLKVDQRLLFQYLEKEGYLICKQGSLVPKELSFPLEKELVDFYMIDIDIEKKDIDKDGLDDYKIYFYGTYFGAKGDKIVHLLKRDNAFIEKVVDINALD